MSACVYCGWPIWFWQRRGWKIVENDKFEWHPKCFKKSTFKF